MPALEHASPSAGMVALLASASIGVPGDARHDSRRQPIMARILAIVLFAAFGAIGCAPEVGSEAWCERMDAKAKGDWSANDATAYAKHCILR